MKKITSILLLLTILLVGCEATQSEIDLELDKTESQVTEQAGEKETQESEPTQQEESTAEEKTPKEEIVIHTPLQTLNWEFNEEKINIAVDKQFPSPLDEFDVEEIEPNQDDAIEFISNESPELLYNSLVLKNKPTLEVQYDRTKLMWDEFMDSLDYSEYTSTKTVCLKNNSIYEEEIMDEYEKYYRYFDENEGVYYEVSDLMMGNFTDEDAELTQKRLGNSCIYKGIDGLIAPTYDPLILEQDERITHCQLTKLDDKSCVFIESVQGENLVHQWVSLKYGIVIQKHVFDLEGLPIQIVKATQVTQKEIDDTVFVKPSDVDYKDITLFIYSFSGGTIEPLKKAMESALPTEDYSLKLVNENGNDLTIYAGGYDGEQSIGMAAYVETMQDSENNEVTLISYQHNDQFTIICPEKEIVEIYQTSCQQHHFFDFEKVGLLGVVESDNSLIYTFKDIGYRTVSDFIKCYEYTINLETNQFERIEVYTKESIDTPKEESSNVEVYTIGEVGEMDESIIEYPEHYQVIDHGEGSYYDGEHPPAWFE